MEDWGFYPHAPFTALSSKTFTKHTQAGFLTLPPFQQPSHPELVEGTVTIDLLKGFPFSFQKRAGLQRRARPRFPSLKDGSRGSLHPDITTYNIFLTNRKKVCQDLLELVRFRLSSINRMVIEAER